MSHARAKLTIHGRLTIFERLEAGWPQALVAAAMGASRGAVAKWPGAAGRRASLAWWTVPASLTAHPGRSSATNWSGPANLSTSM